MGNETCRTSQALPWRIGSLHAYNITERTVSGEYTIHDPMARDLLIKEALGSITGYKA